MLNLLKKTPLFWLYLVLLCVSLVTEAVLWVGCESNSVPTVWSVWLGTQLGCQTSLLSF